MVQEGESETLGKSEKERSGRRMGEDENERERRWEGRNKGDNTIDVLQRTVSKEMRRFLLHASSCYSH